MVQIGMGMQGIFVMHPRDARAPRVDRDFAIMLNEWTIKPGTNKSDTTEPSDFNVLTFNSKVFPATSALVAKLGDRVRIRLGNLSALDHHPIHLHGYQFRVAATDGGRIPEAGQWPETTVLVPVGSTRDIEFVADQPGDWALHCHMTHHTMNQMGHRIPIMLGAKTDDLDAKVRQLLPDYMTMGNTGMGDMAAMGMAAPKNSIPMVGGKGPFGTIDMGGMFTVFKVRHGITSCARTASRCDGEEEHDAHHRYRDRGGASRWRPRSRARAEPPQGAPQRRRGGLRSRRRAGPPSR